MRLPRLQDSHRRMRIPTHRTCLLRRGFRKLGLFPQLLIWVSALGCRGLLRLGRPLHEGMYIPVRSVVVCLWVQGVLVLD